MYLRLHRDNKIDEIKLLIIISHLAHALSPLVSTMNVVHLWPLIAAADSFLSWFLIFWLPPLLFDLKVFDLWLSWAEDKVKVGIANFLPSKKFYRIDKRFLLLLCLRLKLWLTYAFEKGIMTLHIGSRCIRVISWHTCQLLERFSTTKNLVLLNLERTHRLMYEKVLLGLLRVDFKWFLLGRRLPARHELVHHFHWLKAPLRQLMPIQAQPELFTAIIRLSLILEDRLMDLTHLL